MNLLEYWKRETRDCGWSAVAGGYGEQVGASNTGYYNIPGLAMDILQRYLYALQGLRSELRLFQKVILPHHDPMYPGRG